jgi:ATPase subunit of ABC transporter with duplicated ATPase domains
MILHRDHREVLAAFHRTWPRPPDSDFLIGDLEPDSGTVSRPKRIGILRQDHSLYDDMRVIDTVICGNKRLWDAITEKEALLAKPEPTDADGEKLGDLECLIAEEDGYTAEPDAAVMLEGLGIPQDWQERPMKELQGGFKLRVLLAHCRRDGSLAPIHHEDCV